MRQIHRMRAVHAQKTLGSAMAAALKSHGARLEDYSNRGALSFVADYLALPQAQRLAPQVEAAIAALQRDWRSSGAGPVMRLDLDSPAGVAALERRMQARYAGKRAYPDHVAELKSGAMRMLAAGEDAGALAAARLAGHWYAADTGALELRDALELATGERDDGPPRASAAALNTLAYELAAAGGPSRRVRRQRSHPAAAADRHHVCQRR
jgi:hypothetical protein